ncbi:MAG: amino acid adenylation domain-containing protein, partial [Myxococcota bacterium]
GDRADLTADRFVPDPLSTGGVLYRTGDRARVHPDGVIEYLGRLDHQVKLRGNRIELGEIEAVLGAVPGVREAAAAVRGDRLLAWVVGDGVDLGAARAFLASRLPDYMVPADLVPVDVFPLSPNGKLDRGALPEPSAPRATAIAGPRTPTEAALVAIWQEVLQRPFVGVHDDFFAVGGHSLLAVQVVSRIGRDLGQRVALGDLFDAPTIARLAEVLTGEKAEPLEPPPVEPPPARELSFAQRRLWFLDRLTPGDTSYHVPVVLRLRGPLDLPRLEAALGQVLARHEALRSSFPERDGAPEVEVAPPEPVHLQVESAGDLPEAVGAEVARPFDLLRGPVFRLRLWSNGPQDHVLAWTVHHIATDGWSTGIVLRELAAAYGGAALGPAPTPYSDHAAWERAELEPRLTADLAWWAEALRGVPALELPTDRPRAPTRASDGATLGFEVPDELVGRLKALCTRTGSTPYLVLFAVFASLLHRVTGQTDLCVGTTVAGRVRPEVEGTVGCFVNTVAVRADLSGDPSLFSILARVRAAVFGAWAHQDVPFDKVVEVAQPARDPSRTPLFQVLFTMNVPETPPSFVGLEVEAHRAPSHTAKFDLSLSIDPTGAAALEYATALFDRAAIERLAAQFVTLLRALLDHPDRPLGEAPLLSDQDRAELLALGAGPALPASRATLVDRVRAQAARTPDAVAVVTGAEESTYAALDATSDRWARHLAAAGARPGTFVGIAVSRGPALVPAVLAALKSGAAYVPLDPAYPAQRLAWMVEDSEPVVILTERALAGSLPPGCPIWCVEDGGPEAEPVAPGPDDLAYLIYTSGSTGRPKAVEIAHRSAVARVEWAAGAYSGHELAGVLAATSLAFDLSVFELFAPLCTGGAVIVARDALALPELPARDRVRLVNTVPSAATELVRLGLPRSVRTVNLAGEALPAALVDQLYAAGVARVVNLYGPSEDTTYSTAGDVPRNEGSPPSIGRPLPGTRALVVDARGRLVPRGVVGELWLSGAGLSRGYHRQPALTAEKFVPDRGGERMYRTGDLVRWRSDGALAFLGRADHQVKLRGFRIELGEVEAALRAHPGVRGAVAAVRDGRLVAWVAGDAVDVDAARATVAARLPEVMVPARIAALDSLPLTANGKVDRARLPELDLAPSGSIAPRNETEAAVARIWSDVLGVAAIGVTDDFFALGGHSLLAVRVVSRIRDGLGVELPVRALFESPTVAAVAARLGAAPEAAAPIPRAPDDGPAPLSFAQERLWFLDRLEPGQSVYNLPIAVRLGGPLDRAALAAALGDVVERHEVLRTRLVADGGPPEQHIDPPTGPAPIVWLDPSAEAEPLQAALDELAAHARQPFDLAVDPPVRVLGVALGERDHLLSITVHHAMADGGSLEVLRTDLDLAYRARVAGTVPQFPPLPIRYRDWARWQRATVDPSGEDLRYWQQHLREVEPIPLPTDHPRPPSRSGRGAVLVHPLPPALTARVAAFAEAAGATRFVVWLAAFEVLLHRWSGATDLAVGTPVANRGRAELEPLIGLFVNTVVTRVDLGGEPGFHGVVARVRDEVLAAFAHAEVPFERVVEGVQPARDPSRTPLFQVLFAHAPSAPTARLGELELREVAAPTATAKFDLSLFVGDDAAAFEYATDLFDPRSIAALGRQLERLVSAALDQPSTPVSRLPLLAPDERAALLELGRGASLPATRDTLVDRFRAQVARTPDAVAVIAHDQRWTYAELDAASDRLAARLAARGARPGTFVGVAVPRGPWLVPAVLGALKSGAAYVPLDPAYPRQRLGFVVDDSAPIAVLVESGQAEVVPAAAATLVPVDEDDGASAVVTSPEETDLAYLIYTSGSTGRPKAVAIEHRAAVARLDWAERTYDAEELSGVLAATSLAFDLSVFELFAPLCTGGTAIVARDALALPELPARDAVRLVNTVPSAGIELLKLGLPPGVRTVNLAGEALPAALVDALYAAGVGRVVNLYGPSEDTTYSTAAEVGPGVQLPPIGRPLPGTRAYVVDPAGELLPAGAVGELWLAGDGQSRGYHGRPALTAERYVPDPFGPPGARAYRTGDRVRWSPDGSLVYLGRADHQVKVRGFRIELGEVEVALRGVPGVVQAVAGVRGGALVAWVVGS